MTGERGRPPLRVVRDSEDAGPGGLAAGRPRIEIGTGPVTIRALTEAINKKMLPSLYVTDGQVVHLGEVSGSAAAEAGDDDSPLPVAATPVTAPLLARILAEDTFTYKIQQMSVKVPDGADAKGKPKFRTETEDYEEESTPPAQMLSAALAGASWPGLMPLRGIAGAPILRPDGTLLQDPGYDERTGLYLASKIPLDHVPDKPTGQQVRDARDFLLEKLLRDFPWVGAADKANYIGILVTPILRRLLRSLIPFGVYTATMPGSGKTILTGMPGMLYGQRVLSWSGSDEELRKAITSVLADPAGSVVFDNLAEGTVISSPVLARLITDRMWADRLLGRNKTAVLANDRLWSATGNNLRLGGDMVTRSVLVGLDPGVPHPELRTGFAISNLDDWILRPANQRIVLWNLLVLVMDWTSSGAPRATGLTMRQFTQWAEGVGGFLSYHGIGGFLGNIEDVRDIDDEDNEWTVFLTEWSRRYGDSWMSAAEVRKSAEPVKPEFEHGVGLVTPGDPDPWRGKFLTTERGQVVTAKSLGRLLTGQLGKFHGPYRLQSARDKHTNSQIYRVEKLEQQIKPANPQNSQRAS